MSTAITGSAIGSCVNVRMAFEVSWDGAIGEANDDMDMLLS